MLEILASTRAKQCFVECFLTRGAHTRTCTHAHGVVMSKRLKIIIKYILQNIYMLNKQINDCAHIFNLPDSAPECEFTNTQCAHVSLLNTECEVP